MSSKSFSRLLVRIRRSLSKIPCSPLLVLVNLFLPEPPVVNTGTVEVVSCFKKE